MLPVNVKEAPDERRTAIDGPFRTRRTGDRPAGSNAEIVLLHVQNDRNLEARLQLALSLARATAAHLTCLHVTPIEAYVTMDSFGGLLVMDKLVEQIDDEEAKIRSALESRLARRGRHLGLRAGHWQHRGSGGPPCRTQRHRGHGAGSAHWQAPGLEISILGDVLASVRTPLLIAGDDQATFDPFGTAVIAWNGSFEAANAVRSAVGLLKFGSLSTHRADHGRREARDVPRHQLTRIPLAARHSAELSVIEAGVDIRDQEVISKTIVARIQALHAAYLVMGGYGHSRVGEFVFGGVTRTLLKSCPMPLVIAH